MRTGAPALMPIFRSDRQARLLALLFLRPGTELSLTDLAAHLEVTAGALHSEVGRLVQAGLLAERFVGRTRLLRANTDARAAGPLAELLRLTYGPEPVVADALEGVPGVEEVHLFGSWARRAAGEPGPEPGDIDVLVIGAPDREEIYAACDRAADRLGIEVNPVIRSRQAWEQGADALVQTARRDAVQVLPRVSVGSATVEP